MNWSDDEVRRLVKLYKQEGPRWAYIKELDGLDPNPLLTIRSNVSYAFTRAYTCPRHVTHSLRSLLSSTRAAVVSKTVIFPSHSFHKFSIEKLWFIKPGTYIHALSM